MTYIFNTIATPAAPASGKHRLFVPTTALPRVARIDEFGNVWYSADIIFGALSADYTLANSAGAAEKAFNFSTNGAVTLPANSAYLLDMQYLMSNVGTTSHTWAVLFAGTATLTRLDYVLKGRSGITSLLTLTAESSGAQQTAAGALPTTALVGTAASTSATENVVLNATGVLRVNAGGTFIPQIKASAATTGTAKMLAGSYIKLTPIGTDAAVTLGAWS